MSCSSHLQDKLQNLKYPHHWILWALWEASQNKRNKNVSSFLNVLLSIIQKQKFCKRSVKQMEYRFTVHLFPNNERHEREKLAATHTHSHALSILQLDNVVKSHLDN